MGCLSHDSSDHLALNFVRLCLIYKVADGIIAPGYEPAALEILKAKKGGKFIVLEAKADYEAPAGEFREVYGVGFYQDRNAVVFSNENLKVLRLAALPWYRIFERIVEQMTRRSSGRDFVRLRGS